jgi:MoaA/NifB/PqqE/SkfB family radical SAM enzyme
MPAGRTSGLGMPGDGGRRAAGDALRKVYVEPTNRCNLACRTCVRNVWDEPLGTMEWDTYERLMADLGEFESIETLAFFCLGEPLLHPRLQDMVALGHERGYRTEVTSNALLLTQRLADELCDAGLDQFVVSVDGAGAESFGDVRSGASLDQVVDNVRFLSVLDGETLVPRVRIGLEFVAMRRNVRELPLLDRIASSVAASFVVVSNVLPYSAELAEETLYDRSLSALRNPGVPQAPQWRLPRMDLAGETADAVVRVLGAGHSVTFAGAELDAHNALCPFVDAGALAVRWDGVVSPCPPLLHSHTAFIRGREKRFLHCGWGRVGERPLREIWDTAAHRDFRERVRAFDFPPCSDCGGCELAETNEEDCFGNPFPVCGDCLWARGIVRCA